METIHYIGFMVILFSWGNGKENGDYCILIGEILGLLFMHVPLLCFGQMPN